ncbi:MarR family winged helix-turn-helix transcriptional regulator [Nereida sp. MMG025]|uniref:MarR family winged helix-turn-helix transcriptional regulator n=1 Tax=Nereida sp. MMG025 TaxID=2909981 RepID=UPI001F2ED60A|nr:MarR family winged helix-turn-helix transcriptional regulator [Nereida sp. MMG025]MCF6444583.1 MarR family winged helix-turn-helix transcriptional regulator [Nereida sp. MMG025]
MSTAADGFGAALFTELLTVDQMLRNRVAKTLPAGMELSHFTVLNHLAVSSGERTPAQLAQTFKVTRGAMTNTLNKLEWMGYVHIRPDWDDARRKQVALSPSGRAARDAAWQALQPVIDTFVNEIGSEKLRTVLPVLREMRIMLSQVT